MHVLNERFEELFCWPQPNSAWCLTPRVITVRPARGRVPVMFQVQTVGTLPVEGLV